jgi:hypothetical protein
MDGRKLKRHGRTTGATSGTALGEAFRPARSGPEGPWKRTHMAGFDVDSGGQVRANMTGSDAGAAAVMQALSPTSGPVRELNQRELAIVAPLSRDGRLWESVQPRGLSSLLSQRTAPPASFTEEVDAQHFAFR